MSTHLGVEVMDYKKAHDTVAHSSILQTLDGV